MAFVRQTELFFIIAALAGVGWTLSASELWVAAQRTIPTWARGRLNAMVIMISQGAMALGGVIWGSAATIAGASSTLLWAAVLFLGSLVLVRRLSINVVESKEVSPISTHKRIGRRLNGLEKNDEQHTSRQWNSGRSAYFHRTCLWFCHGPLPRLPGADTNPGAVSANMRGTHKETQIRFRVADA